MGRILLALGISLLAIAISSPLGGMLRYWYEMRAGYFPADWARMLLVQASLNGWEMGWLVMLLSIPYGWLGLPIRYYLLRMGNRLFTPHPPVSAPAPG